jgi:hypothetical protein
MLTRTTHHPIDFAYTDQELQALFRVANPEVVVKGGFFELRRVDENLTYHRMGQIDLDTDGQAEEA